MIDLFVIPENPNSNNVLLNGDLVADGEVDTLFVQLRVEPLECLQPVVLSDSESQQVQTLFSAHETGLKVETGFRKELTDRVVVEVRKELFERNLESGVFRNEINELDEGAFFRQFQREGVPRTSLESVVPVHVFKRQLLHALVVVIHVHERKTDQVHPVLNVD